jgi:hypothetical protein
VWGYLADWTPATWRALRQLPNSRRIGNNQRIVAVLKADVGPDHTLASGLVVTDPVEHRLAVEMFGTLAGDVGVIDMATKNARELSEQPAGVRFGSLFTLCRL